MWVLSPLGAVGSSMSSRVANCPNCGGQVEFRAGTSLITVCPYCSSMVARRGDDVGELEITGQVAPLIDLGSPLSLGLAGRDGRLGFSLIGRAQLDWGNGPWNEWYASFDDGSWGWIAEAQGKVYLTRPTDAADLPRFHQARVGLRFQVQRTTLVVTERRKARLVAAEGELPFHAVPGSSYGYVDAEGGDGAFATIDYGDGDDAPTLFLGKEANYRDLFGPGIMAERQAGRAQGEALNCPNCAAPVELRSPETAQRLTCSSCDALLDCERGSKLEVLEQARQKRVQPVIPLGSKGQLRGREVTVYGVLVRSVHVEGVRYPWEEYLLKDEGDGAFRWLVIAEGHYSFVSPVSAGEVNERQHTASCRGRSFRFFQGGTARVDALSGEFYWKVSRNELAGTADYVSPPLMLSKEENDEEVVWSLGEYLSPEEVQAAFRLKTKLPRPRGIAPHQPNPTELGPVAKLGLILSVVFLLVGGLLWLASDKALVLTYSHAITESGNSTSVFNRGQQFITEPFELPRRSNLEIRLTGLGMQSFLFLDGGLVATDRSEAIPFGARAELVEHGVRKVYLGEVPAGTYVIRASPEWTGPPPTGLTLEVRRNVFRPTHLLLVLVLLWAFPLLLVFQRMSFEKQRWANAG